MTWRMKAGASMGDAATIASAVRLAHGCLSDARTLLRSGSRNAAYLAEQALEQLIRAFATSEQVHIPRSDAHQLDKVIRAFPDEHGEKTVLKSLTWLEAYATTFRYPLPSGQIPKSPDAARLAQALDVIEALLGRAASHFGVDLSSQTSPATRVAPSRLEPDAS